MPYQTNQTVFFFPSFLCFLSDTIKNWEKSNNEKYVLLVFRGVFSQLVWLLNPDHQLNLPEFVFKIKHHLGYASEHIWCLCVCLCLLNEITENSTEGWGRGSCKRLTCVFESVGKSVRLSNTRVSVTEGLATSVAGGTAPNEVLVLGLEVVGGSVLLHVVVVDWVFAAAVEVVAIVTVEVEDAGVITMLDVTVIWGASTWVELGLSISDTSSILGMSGRRRSTPDGTDTLVGRDQPTEVVGTMDGKDDCMWYHRYVCVVVYMWTTASSIGITLCVKKYKKNLFASTHSHKIFIRFIRGAANIMQLNSRTKSRKRAEWLHYLAILNKYFPCQYYE